VTAIDWSLSGFRPRCLGYITRCTAVGLLSRVWLSVVEVASNMSSRRGVCPLEGRCLVCRPVYFGAPLLAIVHDGRAQLVGREYVQTAYESWFARYGLEPRDFQAMWLNWTLGDSPLYHPCGNYRLPYLLRRPCAVCYLAVSKITASPELRHFAMTLCAPAAI